jgi:tRNA dimethylallyltransferase
MKQIYVITGQTATGKTQKAIDLASADHGEIINADSRQIYKKLDLITGKDLNITDGDFHLKRKLTIFDIGFYMIHGTDIPLWLYDVIDPNEPFSAFDYRECALAVIADIIDRGKTPIIVGGTYFYLKHLLYGSVQMNGEPDSELRQELNQKKVHELQYILETENEALFHSLNDSDKQNPHRLIRKIEITRNMGTPEAPPQRLHDLFPDHQIVTQGYYYGKKESLAEAISKRVEKRLERGAVLEVQTLISRGYHAEDPGLKTIGYVQIYEYLQKRIDYMTMKQEWITKELQYAKRQLTFMKQNVDIQWHHVDEK